MQQFGKVCNNKDLFNWISFFIIAYKYESFGNILVIFCF